MARPSLPADARRHAREATQIRDALRHARRDLPDGQSPEIAELVRGMLTRDRFKGPEHILALMRDAAARGASLEQVLAPVRALQGIVEGWYPDAAAAATFAPLHTQEERAEARKEVAEAEFSERETVSTALALLEADEAHRAANAPMLAYARRVAFGGIAS